MSMSDEATVEDEGSAEQAVEALYSYAAGLMKNKESDEAIVADLVQKGLSQETASSLVGNLRSAIRSAKRKAGIRNIVIGSLWCVGGLVITALTYSMASGGGTYIVTWGAIVFGAVQAIRGLIQVFSA